MNDNKVMLIGIAFFLLCIGLIAGIYIVDGDIRYHRDEFDRLDQQRANFQRDNANLHEQIRAFTDAFDRLARFNVNPAANEMDFYSQVQQVIDPHIWTNEIVIISAVQGGIGPGGRASHTLTLRGDYYTFKRILAEWRNLNITVRVSGLTIARATGPQAQSGEIVANLTLEATIAAN